MIEKTKGPDAASALYEAIIKLQTPQEAYRFFCDLCTVSELKAMEQRFQVAGLLAKGYIYTDIVEQTGASSATISRVNRCLQYGDDGYRTVLSRMEPENAPEDPA